jgi:WD40 repeat protein
MRTCLPESEDITLKAVSTSYQNISCRKICLVFNLSVFYTMAELINYVSSDEGRLLTMSTPRIFVSHSHLDDDFGLKLINDLRAYLGEEAVWYDSSGGLSGGDAWWDMIVREITERDTFLVILSSNALSSKWVRPEMAIAYYQHINTGKRLLPIRFQPCEVPVPWELIHSFNFTDPQHYDVNLAKLLTVLGFQTNRLSPQRGQLSNAPRVYHGHTNPVSKLAWSPNSQYFASVSREKTVQIWNDGAGLIYQTCRGNREPVNAVAWSPDGTCIVYGDSNGSIYIWDTITAETRLSLNNPKRDAVNDLTWSPASCIAVARASNIVQIYDTQLRECTPNYIGHSKGIGALNGVLKVAWSPDGTLVASSAWDRTVRVWVPATGITICTYHGHGKQTINDLSWSPEGTRLATAGSDGTIQVWNGRTGSSLFTYSLQSGQFVASVRWSPDGTCLASAGSDGSIHIWDVTNENNILVHPITEGKTLRAIDWSPDGQRLAVACPNGDIQIWTISLNPRILHGQNVQPD